MGLLERDVPLQQLQVAWDEATSGEGRIALVSGEAGVGKSSLVRHFVREHSETATTLWGACDALFTPRPLGPVHDMAEAASGRLATLLAGDAPRAQILSAFLDLLHVRPTLVVFEDVHWADEATLDLLRYVGRRIADTCALLIATYRDDELTTGHPLRVVLGDLSSSTTTRRLTLEPLSEAAVRQLARAGVVDAAALYRQTGGNPFFVTEVLAAGGGMPPTVRDAVLARAARVSRAARELLEVAAVVGQRAELSLLLAMAGDADDATVALDENLRGGMLVSEGTLISFRHDLAREAILEAIAPLRRRELHRRALAALSETAAATTDPARLAHHAHGAGDGAAVLQYAPTAARQSVAAGAHRSAADLFEMALPFADQLPRPEHAQLLETYAGELNLVDRRAEGVVVCQQAADLWRELGEPVRQGNMLAALANMLIGVGRSAEAARYLDEAIHLLEANPPSPELANAYRMQTGILFLDHEYHSAIEMAAKSIAVSEEIDDTDNALITHNLIGSSWLFIDYERGCQYLEANLSRARDRGLMSIAGHAYTNLASASSELFHLRRAERYLAAGLAFTAEHDLDRYRLYMTGWEAMTLLRLGRWDEVAAVAEKVLNVDGVSIPSRITALCAIGSLRARRGEAGADVALDEALELTRELSSLHRVALVRAARAEAAWLAGDTERAAVEASAAYDLAVDKRHPWFAGELALWLQRSGVAVEAADWLGEPYRRQLTGDWRGAAESWTALRCPYEAARALADGDADARIAALSAFDELGASAAADALRREMRLEGVAGIPRGPRQTTRDNPYGLTARQLDVLRLLAEGLTNTDIAARLHLSPKTVDHHVSAVLGKLDVHTREDASDLARAAGLI